ncbi:MAG: hypothetical protein ACRC67_05215 [Inquilinus sp.]|uniref:hypothetical protein n=1 Tax=Inquilinus sp. TaxID=1932117 RepID=UPI003F3D90BD
MRRDHGRPERVDDGLRWALADRTPAAIADAVIQIRDEEATALHQLRALLRP